MSTKFSIKFDWDEATGDNLHVYMDGVDHEHVYLDLHGFPIEVDIRMGEIKPRITVQLWLASALKLGIVDREYVAQHEPFIRKPWAADPRPMSVERYKTIRRRRRATTEARLLPRGMKVSEFKIGLEFWMSRSRWRCTDVGSRLVVAIKLNEYDHPSWYDGPPYKVVEHSLDEYDLMAAHYRKTSETRIRKFSTRVNGMP